jgi:mRNA-degrading endonuclease RelE of RelBE toxin-antitoxin system
MGSIAKGPAARRPKAAELDRNVIEGENRFMTTVVLTPAAIREIEELPLPIIARLQRLVQRLQQWPAVSGAKPLKGDLAGKYRLRTGDYRVQFRVETTRTIREIKRVVKKKGKEREVVEEQEVVDFNVVVEKVGHRDGFYDE